MEYTVDQIKDRIKKDPEMITLAQDDPTEFKTRATEIYERFGYNSDGKPMPTVRKAIRAGSRAIGIPEAVGEGIVAMPLPIAGGIAGAAVGAGSTKSIKGGVAGAVAGSVLGELGNTALGITEPSSLQDLAVTGGSALVGPGLGRLGSGLVKLGKRIIPGMGAGLNEFAGQELVGMLKKMRVTRDDVDLFRKQLGNIKDFDIPIPELKKLLVGQSKETAVLVQRGSRSQSGYENRLASYLQSNPEINKGKIGSKQLMELEHAFNLEKGEFPHEAWGLASKTIVDEMETALSNPKLTARTKGKIQDALTKYKDYITVNRKFHADEAITKAMKIDGSILKSVSGDPDLVRFDSLAFKKFINNDPAFTKAFPMEERQAIADAIKDLGYISKPPSGNIDAVNLAKRYGVGGTLGWLAAGPMGAFGGAAIEEGVRKMVTSESGRAAVRYLAKKNRGRIDMLEVDRLSGQIAAGAGAGTIPGLTGRTGGGALEPNAMTPQLENQE